MKETFVGITEARERFKDLIDQLEENDVVVLRHNHKVAMIVDPEKIERLVSRIEDLEDERDILIDKLEGSSEELIPHEEVVRRHGSRVAVG
jgi:prevent-host-death family protein